MSDKAVAEEDNGKHKVSIVICYTKEKMKDAERRVKTNNTIF